jgi:hypothetical protein
MSFEETSLCPTKKTGAEINALLAKAGRRVTDSWLCLKKSTLPTMCRCQKIIIKTTAYYAKCFSRELTKRCASDIVEKFAGTLAVEESRAGGLGKGVRPIYPWYQPRVGLQELTPTPMVSHRQYSIENIARADAIQAHRRP